MFILPYLKIIRLTNAAMATGAVYLGAWISSATLSFKQITILAVVALFSTGFGNIINDLIDIESDRINHPDRPLPRGDMHPIGALLYCLLLATFGLLGAFYVAPLYGFATLVPLLLLTIYAKFLKGTPLLGNIIVSLMVAYALLFGSLKAPNLAHLFLPATIAMFLNFSREIIKDIQDDKGDRLVGISTTAILPTTILKRLLFILSAVTIPLMFLPFILSHFGLFYAGIVLVIAIPLHVYCFLILRSSNWKGRCAMLSTLYKFEMFSGLIALAADRLLNK